jgi:hypothetical protein
MADNETIDRKGDDAADDRRQFIARFGKLALVAAPTVSVLVTSMSHRAIALSSCPPGYHLDETLDKCIKNPPNG